jgi:PEP-CTERM motif
MRFSMKAIIVSVFALLAMAAYAPTASADGGTLEVFNHDTLTLNSFSMPSAHALDTNIQLGPGATELFLGGIFGNLNTLTIDSGGVTYTFTGVKIKDWNFTNGFSAANIDFKFKGESTSATVPEPSTMMLIGCGLLALAIASSRKMLRA